MVLRALPSVARTQGEESMRAPWRLAMATGIVSILGTGLYACGSTDGGGVANDNADTGGHPATPAGGETGTTDPVGEDGAVADTYVPPTGCAILDSDAGTVPPLEPAACKS